MSNVLNRHSIQISFFIPAIPEKVYAAWATTEMVSKWYASDDIKAGGLSLDVRVGGKFSATMIVAGEEFTIAGVYKEILPNRKLVFTTEWQDPLHHSTLTTVEFRKKDAGTELLLTQENFANSDEAEGNKTFWLKSLGSLAQKFLDGQI